MFRNAVTDASRLNASWLNRWLRAVTNDWIWLGPSLRAHLGDPSPLADIADLVAIGDAARIRLRPGHHLDQLEVALAPILPSAADWRRACDCYYGRKA